MTALVAYMLLFTVLAVFFVFIHLVMGKFLRPSNPNPEKASIYECGEPAIGSSWIQFDLRFYVVALLFVIFDVEVAFFFPWAVVFGKMNTLGDTTIPIEHREAVTAALDPNVGAGFSLSEAAAADQAVAALQMGWVAFFDILVFFGVLLVGFAYLWKRGDLDWVRSTATERAVRERTAQPPPAVTRPREAIGV